MSAIPKRLLSPDEYLAIERKAEFRSEHYRGEMFAMAGGSPNHSHIQANVIGELRDKLKGRPCIVHTDNLRIRVTANGLYTYPDASVICGTPEFDDQRRDTVLNPTVIVEVLSPITERYDRSDKFGLYAGIPTLREYLLISQYVPRLEHFARNANGTWTLTIANGLEQTLHLPAIGVTLALGEVYDKVVFEVPTGLEIRPWAAT